MCLHGKSEVKKGAATHRCRRCGALTDRKSHLCKPEKIKKSGKKKSGKKKGKKGRKKDGKGKKKKAKK